MRDLDFLKLHLFVLHNTDTVSFPLSTSRFLRDNKHTINIPLTTEIPVIIPHQWRERYMPAAFLTQLTWGFLCISVSRLPYTPFPPPRSHLYTGACTQVYRFLSQPHPVFYTYVRETDVFKCVWQQSIIYSLSSSLFPLPWRLPPLNLVSERHQSPQVLLRSSSHNTDTVYLLPS